MPVPSSTALKDSQGLAHEQVILTSIPEWANMTGRFNLTQLDIPGKRKSHVRNYLYQMTCGHVCGDIFLTANRHRGARSLCAGITISGQVCLSCMRKVTDHESGASQSAALLHGFCFRFLPSGSCIELQPWLPLMTNK